MKHPYHLRVIADELNLVTMVMFVLVVIAVALICAHLWRLVLEERVKIRAEMPKALVGELMTTDEFVHMHRQVYEVQAKLEYVETRLDSHLAEAVKQQIAGHG